MSRGVTGKICTASGQLHVEWKLKDYFIKIVQSDEFWVSEEFHFSEQKLTFLVYPKGQTGAEGHVGLYVNVTATPDSADGFTFTIGIKAKDGSVYKSENGNYLEGTKFGTSTLVKEENFLEDKSIVESLGFVTFFCLLSIPPDCKVDKSCQTLLDDFIIPSRDFKNLFLSGNGSDVTINVKDRKFQAHKAILAARSPVFGPMLSHDMEEKNTAIVNVDDCEPGAFKEFLQFLYCGQTENLNSDNVVDVYCIADKYNQMELKARCSQVMKLRLNADTFCDFVTVAIRHSDTKVLKYAKKYFVKKAKEIVTSTKWMPFTEKYPNESNELIINVVDTLSGLVKDLRSRLREIFSISLRTEYELNCA